MKKLLQIIAILGFVFINDVLAEPADAVTSGNIKSVVEKYCSADFNGVPDIRSSLAKFTAKRESKERIRDPELKGRVIAYEADPILIVDSYQIQEISIRKNGALAVVAYDRLAKSHGEGLPGRKIIPEHVTHEIVKLHLVYDRGNWLILDPPLPRIAAKALIQYYENLINPMESWIHKDDVSDAQRKNYNEMQDTVKVLKSIFPKDK